MEANHRRPCLAHRDGTSRARLWVAYFDIVCRLIEPRKLTCNIVHSARALSSTDAMLNSHLALGAEVQRPRGSSCSGCMPNYRDTFYCARARLGEPVFKSCTTQTCSLEACYTTSTAESESCTRRCVMFTECGNAISHAAGSFVYIQWPKFTLPAHAGQETEMHSESSH